MLEDVCYQGEFGPEETISGPNLTERLDGCTITIVPSLKRPCRACQSVRLVQGDGSKVNPVTWEKVFLCSAGEALQEPTIVHGYCAFQISRQFSNVL